MRVLSDTDYVICDVLAKLVCGAPVAVAESEELMKKVDPPPQRV